jgi:hypothetical protein
MVNLQQPRHMRSCAYLLCAEYKTCEELELQQGDNGETKHHGDRSRYHGRFLSVKGGIPPKYTFLKMVAAIEVA